MARVPRDLTLGRVDRTSLRSCDANVNGIVETQCVRSWNKRNLYLIGREIFYTTHFINTTLKISLLILFDGIRVSKKISKEITKFAFLSEDRIRDRFDANERRLELIEK